jgi:hypothetical protein
MLLQWLQQKSQIDLFVRFTNSQSIFDYKVDASSGTKAQNGKFIYIAVFKESLYRWSKTL